MKETYINEHYKKVDGKFYLRELQSNGNLEWIEINIGNKKNISSHANNRSNRLDR